MHDQRLIPDLFRTEFSKICAVLNHYFRFQQPETAEDLASAAFQSALETWPYQGIPPNPKAWLYRVAKHKAINHMKAIQRIRFMDTAGAEAIPEPGMGEEDVKDSQLATLFAICDPILPAETQIGLALRILCGFGIDEIAAAFMVDREVINKRLYRGRERLRTSGFDPGRATQSDDHRLEHVLLVLYLLFNEGYYSETHMKVIRPELCTEAIRLVSLLLDDEALAKPMVHALFALMNFQASRLKARISADGHEILYADQDRDLWDQALITTGAYHLYKASSGKVVSVYHLEASIAYWYTRPEDTEEKWRSILNGYNQLLQIQYSPMAAVNRVYAYAKLYGDLPAIAEAEKIKMEDNAYYHILLGELYAAHHPAKSAAHFEEAKQYLRREKDQQFMDEKIKRLF